MKSAERIKYFYETIISENQIERMAEFISPECCVKMGEKLIPVGIDGMKEHIKATKQTYPDYRMKIIKQFCDGIMSFQNLLWKVHIKGNGLE